MVFADVQAGRHLGVQALGGFQLKARQLEHVELNAVVQQIQRWRTQVAANRDTPPCRQRHLADQRGHGALGIRAGDRNDRCLGFPGEQVDVAGQLHTARGGRLQCGRADRQPGADDQLAGAAEEVDVQLAATHLDLRILRGQGGQLRRVGARVGHRKRQTAARQMANHGEAALAEADNDAELVGCDEHVVHLSFSVARPTSTRITVMIQKRTMTRGSGQPLSSKW